MEVFSERKIKSGNLPYFGEGEVIMSSFHEVMRVSSYVVNTDTVRESRICNVGQKTPHFHEFTSSYLGKDW